MYGLEIEWNLEISVFDHPNLILKANLAGRTALPLTFLNWAH